MFDFELETMISQQLVGRGIRDERVIGAFRTMPRKRFVPDHLETKAYADLDLPIGLGQTMSTPYAVARMLAELGLEREFRVLEVGTGSGFLTALLSGLVKEVCSIELLPELAARARKRLVEELRLRNVSFHVGNGHLGWSERAPFDAILVSAACASVPEPLIGQLREGGHLVIAIGDELEQALHVYRRDELDADLVRTFEGDDWDLLLSPLEQAIDDDD